MLETAGRQRGQRRQQVGGQSARMDGVPVCTLAARCLPLARPSKLRGCLNSTTTVVLTHMEDHPGCSFAEALAVAQAMGIAETDPSGDVDGMIATLAPYHRMMQTAPQTLSEVSFQQSFGRQLDQAWGYVRRYQASGERADAALLRFAFHVLLLGAHHPYRSSLFHPREASAEASRAVTKGSAAEFLS